MVRETTVKTSGLLIKSCLVLCVIVATGCGKSKDKGSDSSAAGDPADELGRTTDTIDASATIPQSVTVGSDNDLSGTKADFPPGSLAITTDVTIEAGLSIATESVQELLAIEGELTAAGPATVFSSSSDQDAVAPFTLAIKADEGTLALAGDLFIVYKIRKASDDKLYLGTIPSSALMEVGAMITFEASHFGVYQAVRADGVGSGSEVETSIPIATKANMPKISFTVNKQTIAENEGPVEVAVKLSQPVDGFVTASYGFGGTATDADHGLVVGSFVLASGETEQSLTFNLVDDDDKESDETLELSLLSVTNARIGDVGKTTITITDND